MKKANFYLVKIKSLRAELSAAKDIQKKAADEVDNIFKEKFSDKMQELIEKSKKENKIENKQEKTKQTQSTECKKVFRKIALKIHPDRLFESTEEQEKIYKEKFNKANQALDMDDYWELVEIATDLDIDLPEVEEKEVDIFQKKINSLKEEISVIESTMVWQWFFADESDKEKILNQLLRILHEKNFGS